jgi:hypothetical protein
MLSATDAEEGGVSPCAVNITVAQVQVFVHVLQTVDKPSNYEFDDLGVEALILPSLFLVEQLHYNGLELMVLLET